MSFDYAAQLNIKRGLHELPLLKSDWGILKLSAECVLGLTENNMFGIAQRMVLVCLCVNVNVFVCAF